MSVNLSPIGNSEQFFDNNGIPLSGGLLYAYQAGSSTPLATYTTISGTVANANPIVLNSSGRLDNEVWLTYGYFYKFVLQTSTGTLLGTYDNIYGIVGVQTAVGTTIPTGMINLWYGAIGSVPAGWYLCDGANGTPDLRDKFVVGAGSTYSVAAVGGTADAVVVTHNHTATSVVTDPTHSHTFTNYAQPNTGATSPLFGNSASTATFSTNAASTGITVATTNASAGVSGTNANLPPYYALCYVMKS
jgi:microcystin-dependent protein